MNHWEWDGEGFICSRDSLVNIFAGREVDAKQCEFVVGG